MGSAAIAAISTFRSQAHVASGEGSALGAEPYGQGDLRRKAQRKREELSDLAIEAREEFMYPSGEHRVSLHPVSATVLATSAEGKPLLVRNAHRPDTWEMPGGALEEGETLHEAAIREVREETGAEIELSGILGVDHNATVGVVTVSLSGVVVGGEIGAHPPETLDVRFVEPKESVLSRYITRPHFRRRTLGALKASRGSYNAFRLRPYEPLFSLRPDGSSRST